jgi:hypothetical protein
LANPCGFCFHESKSFLEKRFAEDYNSWVGKKKWLRRTIRVFSEANDEVMLLIDFELAKLLRVRCRSDALAKAFPLSPATRMFLEPEKFRSRS